MFGNAFAQAVSLIPRILGFIGKISILLGKSPYDFFIFLRAGIHEREAKCRAGKRDAPRASKHGQHTGSRATEKPRTLRQRFHAGSRHAGTGQKTCLRCRECGAAGRGLRLCRPDGLR